MVAKRKAGGKDSKGPRIGVDPPGPRSRELMALKERHVPQGVRVALPIVLARGEGAIVEDVDGNRYIDVSGGIGVLNSGHRPRDILEAVGNQLDRLMHISMMVAGYDPYLRLAEKMAEISPGGALTKSIFVNSGSEAVENAAKVARAHNRRKYFISFRSGFHGRTFLGMSLTGKEKPYREGFGPFLPEVLLLDYPYPYRSPQGDGAGEATLAALEDLISRPPYQGNVSALFAEPLQGEGGFIVPPRSFFRGLARRCEAEGILLVDDEVQAGLGRTGRMWAIDHWGVVPDLLVSGKAVGGGLPIGGVTGRPEVMDAPMPGSLGGTFGGNPLSCAAGLASIKLVEALLPGVPKLEGILAKGLIGLQDRHHLVGDVRGMGAMWAIELVRDPHTKEPAVEEARRVQLECLRQGLLILTAGFHNNCIRLLPPLNMAEATLLEALEILDRSLAVVGG